MIAILVNYNYTPDWLLTSDLDYFIYDRSDSKEYLKDFPQERIVYRENRGNVDYDKLSYLVDNYQDLPDVFLWGKTNLFKYVDEETFNALKEKGEYAPLLRQDHKTYMPICYYQDGMYHELNNSWYFGELDSRYPNYNEWAKAHFLPSSQYLAFNPGGNFILTKQKVYKYGVDFYDSIRQELPYCQNPAEAHCAERSYNSIWS